MAFEAVIRMMSSFEFRSELLHITPQHIFEAPLQHLHGGASSSVVPPTMVSSCIDVGVTKG